MNFGLSRVVSDLVAKGKSRQGTEVAKRPPSGEVPAGVGTPNPAATALRIRQNPQHPEIILFESRSRAQTTADTLGPPWVPIAYACGYVLTDGWHFHDANGRLPTFCPVPPEALPAMQQLVGILQREALEPNELATRIAGELRLVVALTTVTPSQFEAACACTLLRIGYAAPAGREDDWLTMPPWALRLPQRRERLPEPS